ncbi:MAG: FG-GAP-like repeat-containing protein, partial [Nitrospirota bacterium]
MSGDGLQDIAVVYEGRIDYWPNLGYGRWGHRITTALPTRLPQNFDPQRVLLGDVDGDGLADLLYVSDREVTLWINRTGHAWSNPITIRGTPAVNTMVTVRLADLQGTGVPGVLWTREANGNGRPQHYFLDFTGGVKPYLLNRMDNNLGAVTEVTYASSTKFYLRDQASPNT